MIQEKRKGFTLVELLVVVAIMGILSSVVVEVVPEAITKAKLASFASTLATVQSAVDRFYVETGEYPCTTQPTSSLPQPIDFSHVDVSSGKAFVGGYLKFEPMQKAQDAGLSPGTITYFVSVDGRVFAATSALAPDTTAYTQDNVHGHYTVLDVSPGFGG